MKPGNTIELTEEQWQVLTEAWTHSVWAAVEDIASRYTDGRTRIEFDEEGHLPTTIWWNPKDGLAGLAHEVGHAMHLKFYPASRRWPTWKCEALALLGTAKMAREGRQEFVLHREKAYRSEFGTAMAAADSLLGAAPGIVEAANALAETGFA